MTYSVDSSFLSDAAGSAQQWVTAIAAHNPAQAADIVSAYVTYGPQCGINYDLALAQACHESGWFTSAHWRTQFNPCGLGVTSDQAEGATFANLYSGVQAHYEHLSCYVQDADPAIFAAWGFLDPRHGFHDGLPLVRDLIRPDRKWAVPGDGYAEAIVALANQVVGDAAAPPVVPPVVSPPEATVSDYPTGAELGLSGDLEIEATSFEGGDRPLSDIDWYVIHDTEGHFQGDIGVLTHGSQSGSVHFILGREPGQVVGSVPIRKTAWTAGNDDVSNRAIQFELSKAPDETGYTDWQYSILALLIQWSQGQGCTVPLVYLGLHPKDDNNGPEPDERGLIGHAGVPDPNVPGQWGGFAHHTDPGSEFDWSRLVTALTGANPTPGPNASPTYRLFPETGHGVDHGFKAWWEGLQDPLKVAGFPISEEMQWAGRTTQFFQKIAIQWFPELKGTPFEFQEMNLGAFFARDVVGLAGLGIPTK